MLFYWFFRECILDTLDFSEGNLDFNVVKANELTTILTGLEKKVASALPLTRAEVVLLVQHHVFQSDNTLFTAIGSKQGAIEPFVHVVDADDQVDAMIKAEMAHHGALVHIVFQGVLPPTFCYSGA